MKVLKNSGVLGVLMIVLSLSLISFLRLQSQPGRTQHTIPSNHSEIQSKNEMIKQDLPPIVTLSRGIIEHHSPKSGSVSGLNHPVSDTRLAKFGYEGYYYNWSGKGVVSIILFNNEQKTGKYKVVLFELSSDNTLSYQGSFFFDLANVKQTSIPIDWHRGEMRYLGTEIQILLEQSNEVVARHVFKPNLGALPQKIELQNVRFDNTRGLRAKIDVQ